MSHVSHVSPAMSPQRVLGRPVEASTRCSLGPSQLDSLHEAQLVETEEVAGKYPRHSGKGAVGRGSKGATNKSAHFFIQIEK